MGFDKTENEKKQKPIPDAGQTLGVCVALIDLGTQIDKFGAKEKIAIVWELPKFRGVFSQDKGEQAMVISNVYNNSLDAKSNYRKMLDSWFAKPIDKMSRERAKKMLGIGAMIQVIHKKSADGLITHANIANSGSSVFPKDKSIATPKTENEFLFFDLTEFSQETFNKIPKYYQEIIMKSPEYKVLKGGSTSTTTSNAIVDAQGADFNPEEDF